MCTARSGRWRNDGRSRARHAEAAADRAGPGCCCSAGDHASFLKLAELKIVDPEFARRIARCAGLRNRLVHEYEEIDPRKVFESLQAATADIVAYMRSVEAYLDGLPGTSSGT